MTQAIWSPLSAINLLSKHLPCTDATSLSQDLTLTSGWAIETVETRP